MSDFLGIGLKTLFYVLLSILVITSQNLIHKEKIIFRVNTIRSFHDIDLKKMIVDLSDKVKRMELSNYFNSENIYHIGKYNRKFIIAEKKYSCLRM